MTTMTCPTWCIRDHSTDANDERTHLMKSIEIPVASIRGEVCVDLQDLVPGDGDEGEGPRVGFFTNPEHDDYNILFTFTAAEALQIGAALLQCAAEIMRPEDVQGA